MSYKLSHYAAAVESLTASMCAIIPMFRVLRRSPGGWGVRSRADPDINLLLTPA